MCERSLTEPAPVPQARPVDRSGLARRPPGHPGVVADDAPASGELVALRDGSRVLIRPVSPQDRALFVAGFARLSPESRYRRFLSAKGRLSEGELDFFTRLDHTDHEALGAQDPVSGEGLGVARYIRLPAAPQAAEAAVVVTDGWQGRGLGSALLDRLAARAAEQGIREFVATLLTANRAMLRLFERIGELRVRSDGPMLEIEVRLAVDGGGLARTLRAAACGDVEAVTPEPAGADRAGWEPRERV